MKTKKSLPLTSCPITRTIEMIGGKWALPIIYVLMTGTKRFKELERSVEGINTRMLVKELKRLEENNIVIREIFAEVPPRVEYSLTSQGWALKDVLEAMKTWDKKFA